MPLAPEAPTHDLQVRTGPAGNPLAIRHDGRIWVVDPGTQPKHWSGNGARDAERAAVAGGPASAEYWRVQARLGSTTPLRTFTLRREPLHPAWILEHISDGD